MGLVCLQKETVFKIPFVMVCACSTMICRHILRILISDRFVWQTADKINLPHIAKYLSGGRAKFSDAPNHMIGYFLIVTSALLSPCA